MIAFLNSYFRQTVQYASPSQILRHIHIIHSPVLKLEKEEKKRQKTTMTYALHLCLTFVLLFYHSYAVLDWIRSDALYSDRQPLY